MPAEPADVPMHRLAWAAAAIAIIALLTTTDAARAAWAPIAMFLSLQGPPAPASANVLSEHEVEGLDSMPAQSQAALLLERSINHYQGANEQIARRVARWRGRLTLEGRLNELFTTALNSDDLRVRAAAIEVDLAARNVEKAVEAVDRLEPIARFGEQGPRVNALWDLALVGNRGVEAERTLQVLLASLHDANENIRYWTVEGLAYLGTDGVIAPLLEAFHDDPSPLIRERAACGLAQSGMLNEAQRRRAVPALIDYAGDGGLDPDTRKWAFQALRDITGQTLSHDAAAWRAWYQGRLQVERAR
jgi:HEAT repeats